MKKNIFFLISLALIFACSPRKNTPVNRSMQSFYTYYNTLYNSKDALQTELTNRSRSHKDNFYAPYIDILTYDEQPLGANIATNEVFSGDGRAAVARPGFGAPGNNNFSVGGGKGASILEISEAKAMKAIAKHSMNFDGVERNKEIFEASILLAQSRIYQGKYLDALDALNYVFTHMSKDKRLPLAQIYKGLAFTKLQDYYRANEAFAETDKKKLKKEYKKLKTIYYSEMLLDEGKYEDAIAELGEAFKVNKNRKLRSRIAFLRGQILVNLGKSEEARASFVTAYKYANDFEFEVKSQIEIAKTFNGSPDDYDGAKNYLEKISKKGTYGSRKNEFYYALGLMAEKAGKNDEADAYFSKSLKMKMSDPQIRGLTYYEIGKKYFAKEDYIGAGAYYDSAVAVMSYAPTKESLADLSNNIKNVTKNYYLVKKNDSILALTKMPEADRVAYFNTYIEKIKEKEAKEALQEKRDEHSKGFVDTFSSNPLLAGTTNTGFQDFNTNASKSFYFDNTSTVAKGQADFKRIWGDRALSDDWRTSTKINSLEDLKNDAMGTASKKDPRRLQPSFYIDQIPKDPKAIADLKKQRDTATLGLGRMYEEYFSNKKLATKTLYDLVDSKPDDDTKLQALYIIFSMNFETNPADAERAKQLILSDFPYTSYAEFVKNPRNKDFNKSTPEVEKMYSDAFELYKEEKFEESKNLINSALEKYPKDALVPKFTLLNAFNTGKTTGKEIMILQLEQIALNYPKTLEGEKAVEILKNMKSDISLEETNEFGEKVPPKIQPQVKPQDTSNNAQQTQDGQQVYERSYGPIRRGVGVPTDVAPPEPQKK